MERMNRRWKSLTREEVQELFDSSSPEKYGVGGLANGEYMPPYTEELTGKSFAFLFEDGARYEYTFASQHELRWCQDGEEHTEYYQGHLAEQDIYFVQHTIKGSVPPQAHTLVFDTRNGLVTLCRARLGNESEAREMSHSFHFGIIEGYDEYPEERHHFTADLVGKAISWTYHEQMPPIKHIYSSELYYTYAMISGDQCWMASNPADFVKINDHLYIFSFIEERQAGIQGLFLINMETLHDVGSFTGINGMNLFECYTVGAKGELDTMETCFTDTRSRK